MKQIKKVLIGLMVLMVLVGGNSVALAETYKLDASHTLVGFTVRHLMISNVNGRFHQFDGALEIDEANKELKSVQAEIKVDSIDTENAKRDGHLKSPDFFDAANHPNITFKSTNITKNGNNYQVTGDLTIRGTTKQVTLKGQMTGLINAGMFGGKKAGFWATVIIDRQDFGLSWSKSLDSGGLVVGNKVKIKLEVEANGS